MQNEKGRGLTTAEAEKRLRQYGRNTLAEKKKAPLFLRFLRQFSDFSVLLLLAAAAFSCAVSFLDGSRDFEEALMIVGILVLNAVFGLVQEAKAERALEALHHMTAPSARVLRDGQAVTVAASELTVGDAVFLEAGAWVPADGEVLKSAGLETDESALTGESDSVQKEKGHEVYLGTVVVGGTGMMHVTKVGGHTKMGQIASFLATAKEGQTPLQKKLAHTGKWLGIGAVAVCIAVFVLGVLSGMDYLGGLMTAVSLAVAAIPEGLPATVTVVLAMGVVKMARHNAIVRKLPAVETLGSVSVICTDKTGTLTQNRMEVVKTTGENRSVLLEAAAQCCHADRDSGNPTEQAIMRAVENDFTRKPILKELRFDSVRKRMSVAVRDDIGYRIVTKGAPEKVLPLCTAYARQGKKVPMTAPYREEQLGQATQLARLGLRVLAVAQKRQGELKEMENELVFLGLIGIRAPLRDGVKEAVADCRTAGIRTVIITGDHPDTAEAVAREAGIEPKVMTGEELDKMSDGHLKDAAKTVNVFARVTPAHKLRLVHLYQAIGAVTAMTGDGVNDAPALRAADIGIAMGASGTEVAREASDMILTDDNFSTIVEAVRRGRGVYANIQKAVRFLLSSNIGELLTILIALLCGWQAPLAAVQLLWVNFVTDSLPAIALGMDPTDPKILKEPPLPRSKSLFSDGFGSRILTEGLMIGAASLLTYYSAYVEYGYTVARTMTFMVLSLSQLVHAFDVRSRRSVFKTAHSPYLWGAFLICTLLQLATLLPPLQPVFCVVALTPLQWLFVAAMSLFPLVVSEVEKWFEREKRSEKKTAPDGA